MDITGKAGPLPVDTDRKGDSFAETMRDVGAATPPAFARSSMSFKADTLATSFSWVSPDFMPSGGDGVVEAIALGEGANDEMRRYEEKTRYR